MMSPSHGGASKHLLIVEDHAGVRKMLSNYLGRRYVVRTAENGAEALKRVKAANFDLIITDGEMPVMSGPDFIREMRGLGVTVPVILFSANPLSEELSVRLRLAGVLRKPHEVSALEAIVRRLLYPPAEPGTDPETTEGVSAIEQTLLVPNESAHLMLTYQDKAFLNECVGTYLKAGLIRGERAVAIASPQDLHDFRSYLHRAGVDVSKKAHCGDLAFIDVATVRSGILTNGSYNGAKAADLVGRILDGRETGDRPVRVYGDGVYQLARDGRRGDSARLEEEWNYQLSTRPKASAMCGYDRGTFSGLDGQRLIDSTCALHSHVLKG